MATEKDPLLHSSVDERSDARRRRSCCPLTFSRRYKNTCMTTGGGLVVLLWSAAANTLGVAAVLFVTTSPLISAT